MNRIIKILIYIFVILIVMAIAIYMYKLYDIRNNGAYYCSLIKNDVRYNYPDNINNILINKYQNRLFYDSESNLYKINHSYNNDVQLKLSEDDKEVIDIKVDVKMFNDKSGLIISTPGPLFGNKKFKVKDGDYKIIIYLDKFNSINIETVFNNIYTKHYDIIEPQLYRDSLDDLYVSFIELSDVMDYIYDKDYKFNGDNYQHLNKDKLNLTNYDIRDYLNNSGDNAWELKRANVQTIKIQGSMFDCYKANLVDYYPKFLIKTRYLVIEDKI